MLQLSALPFHVIIKKIILNDSIYVVFLQY